ncbi:MAG TPA: endo-1,4-beta-xylanase [Bacteroidota bacterium]|nr:endo-1,4-beta-xylanase [Bacteroidota bacterium]
MPIVHRLKLAARCGEFLSLVIPLILLVTARSSSQPLANGKPKFLGNIISNGNSIRSDFSNYWNQITPENAGKWGSVEAVEGYYDWTQLDNMYSYAKTNGFLYKHHNLIWGSQYPSWITSLDSATLYQKIVEWIMLAGQRYPNADFCDVVNEPIHTALPAIFKTALGGNGATGWDWVITAFQLARQYWPNTKLLVNEYSVINGTTDNTTYLQIINLLKDRGLIDGIGVQAHYFEVDGGASPSTLKTNLDKLTATGLPVYISEFDINQPIDSVQSGRYQEFFPIFWEDPGVYGITLWGYVQNQTWKPSTYLITTSGTERPALQWLRQYILKGSVPAAPVLISPINIFNAPKLEKFTWHSALHAASYELQVALDNAFELVLVDTTTADTTASPSTALDDTTRFYWRVCGIDSAGPGSYSVIGQFTTGTVLAVREEGILPKGFALSQNYPNPFNPSTMISYQLPVNSFVTLKVYDIAGREVRTLISGSENAGSHAIQFDGSSLPSGVYYYRLRAGNFTSVKKLALIK